MTSPTKSRSHLSRTMTRLSNRMSHCLLLVKLSPTEPPDPVRVPSIVPTLNPPDPPDPPNFDGSFFLLWINPSTVSFAVLISRSTLSIFISPHLSVLTKKISVIPNVRLSNFLTTTVDVFFCVFSWYAVLSDMRLNLLSSLKYSSSTSSLERTTTIPCASYHQLVRFKPLPVSYFRNLDVCENNIGWLVRLESYSPLLLLMDVNDNLLNLILGLCLVSVSLQNAYMCSCSDLVLPRTQSLFSCSPLHKPELNLLIVYELRLRLYYILVCGRLLYRRIRIDTSYLGPISPPSSPWRLYRCSETMRLALGWEGPSTDDSLSVTIKGSTLISAADLKIVNLVLVTGPITEVSSLVMILIFDSVILVLRFYVVGIQGRLYIVCRLGSMIASILCFYLLHLQHVVVISVVFITLLPSVVNHSCYGE